MSAPKRAARRGAILGLAALAGTAGCVQVLALDVTYVDDDAGLAPDARPGSAPPSDGSADAVVDASADGPIDGAVDGPLDAPVDASADGPDEAPCADLLTGDILLCVPRGDGADPGLDGSAPFVSGAYSFDQSNAGAEPPPGLPATQRTSFYVAWNETALSFSAHMTDPDAVTDDGEPSIELMACAGDPDSDWDETECVDFSVTYANELSGPVRFDTEGQGIDHLATGAPTDFIVNATIPAALFGGLASGRHIALDVNAVSYQRVGDGGGEASAMYAFSVNRTCHHQGDGGFSCGGATRRTSQSAGPGPSCADASRRFLRRWRASRRPVIEGREMFVPRP